MLRNYLKTSLRFLLKNKTFSFINIVGLAIGTLCCLYIVLYIEDQYSYDRHYNNAGDIYRITSLMKNKGDVHKMSTSSPPIAPAMKNDFAEVQQFTRVVPAISVKQHLLHYKDKSVYEKDAVFVDSTFFDVFTYHFVHGTPKNVLNDPYSVVFTKAAAERLFGNEDPVGKMIEMDNAYGRHPFKVTGVIDESLGKSHIRANMFITLNSGGIGDFVRTNDAWAGNNFVYSYVKLYPNANPSALEKKLPVFLNKYGQQQLKDLGMEKQLHLQPVASIHTSSDFEHEMIKPVSPSFLLVLLLIAVLIQVIACINFMNLSTARASKRAKEVGVRKVIGAGKKDLIRQFLGESLLLVLIGVIIAFLLLIWALPLLNTITNAEVSLKLLEDYRIWTVLAAIIIVTGLLAGSYPAFYLSAFQAIKVLKGNFTNHISATGIRRSLVVFQFILSIILISGIIIIYAQLNYIKNKDLGFDKNQKLTFSFYTNDSKAKMESFANDLRQLSEVKAVSRANNYPGQFVFNDMPFYLPGGNIATGQDGRFMLTDENFVKAAGLRLENGRDFRVGDSGKVIINEMMAKRLGLDPATAEGKTLYSQVSPETNKPLSFEIAGVIRDFNISSLHDQIDPFLLIYDKDAADFSNIIVSASSADYKTLISRMEDIWHKDFPEVPFEYNFIDDQVQKLYETEITLSHIINSFTLMAILISCLGLFGLAAFSAEQRSKEIGIRKVLGSSVSGIVSLLSSDFLKLVMIALLIATPISWWAMNKWLQAYVYRVDISWWMFVLAGLIAVIIALSTVSFQALKAATINPVKTLKSE